MRRHFQIVSLLLFVFAANVYSQCINMTDLNDPNILCTYGSVAGCDSYRVQPGGTPYDTVGVIDYGSQSGLSRHTIHTSTNERDHNVLALKTIPEGATSSIRLGNWQVWSQAESITFTYEVTAENPLLLLKYAAVMENPLGHDENEQPRLKLEVRDQNNQAIDSICTFFDFIASPSLGWNTIPQGEGTNLLWKDWTNIGVNLEDHIGETIKIRLTNQDCGRCGHFGYAYIHLSCVEYKIQTTACGNDVYMEAPAGYEYRWYKKNNPNRTLGTSQNITVPADGAVYVCECQQIGKPLCHFDIEQAAAATPRYPIADFMINKRLGCADTLYLTNTSGISSNGVDKNMPTEPCDSVVWVLDDGRQFTQYDISSIPIVFANTGWHTITQTSFLKKGNCYDTKTQTIYVHGTTDPHSYSLSATICEGDFYYYNGQRLTKDSTYTFTFRTSYNCDSIVNLRLIVHPTYLKTDTIYLCDGEAVDYHGQRITSNGTFYANYKTIHGCDSIFKAVVYRKSSYYIEKDTTICEGAIFDFSGRLLQSPGVYWDSARTVYGCDSITKLTLHVNPSYLIPTYVEICHDHSYWFRGRELDAPGIYYDTLLTQSGCDSIFQLVLNKTPIHLFQDTVTICEGSYYNFRGRKVYDAGFHYDSLKTVSGCDSVYQLLLQVEPLALQVIDTAFCGEVYDFRGMPITQSGTYFDTVKTAFGCDSVYQLNLTFYPSYLFKQIINQCEGDVFEFRGELIDKPGVYHDSLITINGCDSVYQLVYNVGPSYLQIKYDTVCSNTPYDFRGRTITRPGIFIDSLTTKSGCDSLFQLVLEHQQSYSFIAEETGCRGTVFFQGKEIEESGYYYDSLQTKVCKCDSVYGLRATILPTYVFDDTVNVCDHERYNFRGREILESGVYYDSLLTFTGCDSVYRLHINVTPTLRDTLIDTVCIGDTYYFAGIPLTQEGFYSDTLADPMGYRCIIHSLALGAKPESRILDANVEMICADDSIYTLVFHYHGSKPYTYSIYYDQHALLHGFLDVVDAPFVDTIYAPMPVYKDGDYLRPDYYHARLEFQNGFCDPHKSGMDFDLLIRYPSWVIRQHWNDVVAVRNAKYNGGYTFSNYEWEVNGRMLNTTDPHYSNLYMPELRFGDLVSAYLTREGENYAIPTCPIEIRDRSAQIDGENPVIVYPTAVPQAMPVVKMIATESAMYYITDSFGHLIQSGNLDNEELQQIQLPSVAGLYYFCIRGANSISTVKVLVQ